LPLDLTARRDHHGSAALAEMQPDAMLQLGHGVLGVRSDGERVKLKHRFGWTAPA
jgi:hypothetical protein